MNFSKKNHELLKNSRNIVSKKLITFIIAITISITCFAQQGINYKAVLKDTNGNLLAGTFMNVQFTIHQSTSTGTIVYQEDYNYTTNANGLLILNIGSDTSPSIGVFEDIDWSADLHFLQTTITYSGGTINFDTTEFMAVPYALYALNVAKKQHMIGIPASSFFPNNNDCSFVNSYSNGGVEITSTNGSSVPSILNAPVQLPHGAQINSITVYYTDNSNVNLSITLIKEFYSPGFQSIKTFATNGNSSTPIEETANFNHTVNNENGGYFIRVYCANWNESGSKIIKGVKIYYTY